MHSKNKGCKKCSCNEYIYIDCVGTCKEPFHSTQSLTSIIIDSLISMNYIIDKIKINKNKFIATSFQHSGLGISLQRVLITIVRDRKRENRKIKHYLKIYTNNYLMLCKQAKIKTIFQIIAVSNTIPHKKLKIFHSQIARQK